MEMFEFLVSQGHREPDLWEHSPEKLELLFTLATERQERETALDDLRYLRNTQAAISACISDKGGGQFSKLIEERKQVLMGKPEKPQDARQMVFERLKSMGAKVNG